MRWFRVRGSTFEVPSRASQSVIFSFQSFEFSCHTILFGQVVKSSQMSGHIKSRTAVVFVCCIVVLVVCAVDPLCCFIFLSCQSVVGLFDHVWFTRTGAHFFVTVFDLLLYHLLYHLLCTIYSVPSSVFCGSCPLLIWLVVACVSRERRATTGGGGWCVCVVCVVWSQRPKEP